MTDIHAPARDDQQTPGTGKGTEAGAPAVSATSPFATYRPGDYVRDVVAALLLFLALALPWMGGARGAGRVEVVLTTALSLASLAIPYLARFGALPVAWTVQSTRKWRVWANLPLVLAGLFAVVLDLFTGSGVGTGLGLALAGALLAATPRDSELGPADLDGRVHDRWRTVLIAAGGVVAVCALISLVQTFFTDRDLGAMLRGPVNFVLVIGLLLLLVHSTWRRDRAARLVLLALGVVLSVCAVFTAGGGLRGLESTHDQRYGIVLLPVLAALAAAPAVRRSPFWESQGAGASGQEPGTTTPGDVGVWVRTAVRSFEVLILVAACGAAGGLATLVGDGFDVVALLRLILCLVIAGVAAFARRSLSREASTGHVPAVAAACVAGVLGLVVVFAASGVKSGVLIVDLVMALGLPGIAAAALMVPKAVREHFDTTGIAGDGEADHSPAWIWAPASDAVPAKLPSEPARERQQFPQGGKADAPGGRWTGGQVGTASDDVAAGRTGTDADAVYGAETFTDNHPVPAGGGATAVLTGVAAAGAGSDADRTHEVGSSTGENRQLSPAAAGPASSAGTSSPGTEATRPPSSATPSQPTDAVRPASSAATQQGTDAARPASSDIDDAPQETRDMTAVLGSGAGRGPEPRAQDVEATPATPSTPATPTPDRPRKRISSSNSVKTYAGQERRGYPGEQPSVAQVAQEPTAREMQGLGGQQSAGDTAVMQPLGATAQLNAPAAQSRWTSDIALNPHTPLADLAVIVQEAPHLRPHVARNPSTYPALLDWLGQLGDPDVDAALRSRR
ncbi:hypothetical protein [Myceligenerans crystallogenes]|uniref:Uncharacterized protein n=1 Tax=Myceligenerans crystallogenes TaxID=316335 RepID=A0ABN2NH79_9MICO